MSDDKIDTSGFMIPKFFEQKFILILSVLSTIFLLIRTKKPILTMFLFIFWFLIYFNLSCLITRRSCLWWGRITIFFPAIIFIIYIINSTKELVSRSDIDEETEPDIDIDSESE